MALYERVRIKPPSYSGTKVESVSRFFSRFEKFMEFCSIRQDNEKTLCLSLMIFDKALEFFDSIIKRDDLSYCEIKEYFMTCFNRDDIKMVARSKLYRRKLGQSETVTEFYSHLIIQKGKFDLSEDETLFIFLNGLGQNMKQDIAIKNPINANVAFQMAKMYEQVQKWGSDPMQDEVGKQNTTIKEKGIDQLKNATLDANCCGVDSTGSFETFYESGKEKMTHFCQNRTNPRKRKVQIFRSNVCTFIKHSSTPSDKTGMLADCEIAGMRMLALLDTGSNATLIAKNVIEAMGIKPKSTISNTTIVAVNGTESGTLGTLKENISINTFKGHIDFQILDNLSYDVVLGSDFIGKYVESINIKNNEVCLKGTNGKSTKVQLKDFSMHDNFHSKKENQGRDGELRVVNKLFTVNNDEQQNRKFPAFTSNIHPEGKGFTKENLTHNKFKVSPAKLASKTVLQPDSETLVELYPDCNILANKLRFELEKKLESLGLKAEIQTVSGLTGSMKIRIRNNSKVKIILSPDRKVGVLTVVEPDKVNILNKCKSNAVKLKCCVTANSAKTMRKEIKDINNICANKLCTKSDDRNKEDMGPETERSRFRYTDPSWTGVYHEWDQTCRPRPTRGQPVTFNIQHLTAREIEERELHRASKLAEIKMYFADLENAQAVRRTRKREYRRYFRRDKGRNDKFNYQMEEQSKMEKQLHREKTFAQIKEYFDSEREIDATLSGALEEQSYDFPPDQQSHILELGNMEKDHIDEIGILKGQLEFQNLEFEGLRKESSEQIEKMEAQLEISLKKVEGLKKENDHLFAENNKASNRIEDMSREIAGQVDTNKKLELGVAKYDVCRIKCLQKLNNILGDNRN